MGKQSSMDFSFIRNMGKLHLFTGIESQGENAAVHSEHEALLVASEDWEPSLSLHLCSGAVSVALGQLGIQLSSW